MINNEEILLNDAFPELENEYKTAVKSYINLNLITLEEWNNKFRSLRDDYGYSIIHYLACVVHNMDIFVTNCDRMLQNRKYLFKRFRVKILTPEEFSKL